MSGDDGEEETKIPIPMMLFGSLSAFSALLAAYFVAQAIPLSTACRAGDADQCQRYASAIRQVEAFGGAAALFGVITLIVWRLTRGNR